MYVDHKSNYYCHINQCFAVDVVIKLDLVSALHVSVIPNVIFTKFGKNVDTMWDREREREKESERGRERNK